MEPNQEMELPICEFIKNLVGFVYEEIVLEQENQPYLNDVQVQCADGMFRVPALLLASISPIFKATAPVADLTEWPSLVMPDVNRADFQVFLRHLCDIGGEAVLDDMATVNSVMEVLCVAFQGSADDHPVDSLYLLDQQIFDLDQTRTRIKEDNKENNEPTKIKRRVGRKPGQKLNIKSEPYMKIEVMDSERTSAIYGLRKSIKRKRFTDEVSEPSDLDLTDDEEELLLGEDKYDYTSDEYAPDETEQKSVEEEDSETEDEFNDDDMLEEDEGDYPDEDEVLDSDDEEIIDASIMIGSVKQQREAKTKDQESFTVKMSADGTIEVIGPDDETTAAAASATPQTPRPRGRPRKRPHPTEESELIGIGRVVAVMEDEDPIKLAFQSKKIYSDAKSDPRSLLKPTGAGPLPLILFCSVCEEQCNGQAELKHHVAKNHKGSKFFILPKTNPHRDCVQCSELMTSYETMVGNEDPAEFSAKNVCFPCPHCRRRYVGHLGGLTNHLINDHRGAIAQDLGSNDADYYHALKRDDERILTCDYCSKKLPHTTAVNKHLIGCTDNDTGFTAGLYCHVCGKMFAQQRYLKDHLARHGKDLVNRPRTFMCSHCPVTCVSQANLEKHVEREHSTKDHDDGFVLHDGCLRCEAMYKSYLDNKTSGAIPFREMVFKCPHCCTVLYANHKHAPRYLSNHINKWHTDLETNDFTLGTGGGSNDFRLRSKLENDTLTCEFCGFASKTRANHNVHLSTCKKTTVPCRPGYMCDTCDFIAGTAVHLRNHLESHNDPKTYACEQCIYTGRSRRYLIAHVKGNHTLEGQRKRFERAYVPCPKCGKLKKDGATIKAHMKKCGTGPPRVNCPECDMEFKRREDMKAHSLIHYGQVTCPIHNILFKQENEVFQHVNIAEPEDKFPCLKCCMCDSQFRHMCLFMKHMRRHLRISPYRCNICQKHVNTYASLALHMKRVHSNEKPTPKEKTFRCDQCGKFFGNRGHLNEHVAGVHDRTNVTNCPVCHKIFNTSKRMRKHLFNAHKESAEEFRSTWKLAEPFTTVAIKI